MKRIIVTISLIVILASAMVTVGFGGSSRTLGLEISKKEIGRYEKMEMEIHINGKYDSPFDPDVVDVVVEMKTPGSDQFTLPAFYCQPYERRKLNQEEIHDRVG